MTHSDSLDQNSKGLSLPSMSLEKRMGQTSPPTNRPNDHATEGSRSSSTAYWRFSSSTPAVSDTGVEVVSLPKGPSLPRELMTSVLPWVLAPLGVAALVGYTIATNQSGKQAEQNRRSQAIAVSQSTRDRLTEARKVPRLVAPDPALVEFSNNSTARLDAAAMRQMEQRAQEIQASLNDDLKRKTDESQFSELLIANQDGEKIASSRATDTNQKDTAWWKQVKQTGQATNLVSGSGGEVVAVDVAQAITDPTSGKLIGGVKGQVPIGYINRALSALPGAKLVGSQQIQILALDKDTIKPVGTLAADGLVKNPSVVGGTAIAQKANELLKQQNSQGTNSAQAGDANSVSDPTTDSDATTTDGRGLLSSVSEGGKQFTLATIPDSNWVVVASVDAAEVGLNPNWIWAIAGVALSLASLAAAGVLLSSQRVAKSLANLIQAFEQASRGNLKVSVQPEGSREVQRLAHSFNQLTANIDQSLQNQVEEARQATFYAELGIAASKGDVATVFDYAVKAAKNQLSADRAVIYCFEPDWSGKIVAEVVDAGWPRALNDKIADPCIPSAILEEFRKGRYVPTSDVHTTHYSDAHMGLLTRLQVKASLVVPIVANDRLLGLLVTHQCASTRVWQPPEINFLRELAAQVGLALTGTTLAAEKTAEAARARQLNKITFCLRESLDRDNIFSTVVEETKEALALDRAVIYLFDEKWQGAIVAEAVDHPWTPALGANISDPCFAKAYIDKYKRGRVQALSNIHEANLDSCYLGQLEPFEVKANIVAPIVMDDVLLGLLVAHQCSGPRFWQETEINFFRQVATQLGFALAQANLLKQRNDTAKRAQQLNEITFRIRQASQWDDILNTTVRELRPALAVDRAIVYLFNENWQGKVVAESVARGFPVAMGAAIADPCFAQDYVEKYRQGRVQALANIHQAGLDPCYLSQLEPFAVKANLVAPILTEGNLLGLLVVHQCSAPRTWTDADIQFIRQTAIQLGFTLEQANLFEQKEQALLSAEAISQEQRQQKEQIQMQLVDLLKDVEGAAMGDLTVRADVTADDIGTVADFFNSIVESLRQIVTQVKQSALQVGSALGENEGAMEHLAEEALKQAEETKQTLQAVEQMKILIETAAASARQAADVAHTAATTAEAGGAAMDLSVQNILGLRETIGETAKKVKRLGESSQQISKVVSLINQIAMQTNLLAINAGIEAARAGAEGQGFAVVAEEVGELAARSAAATQEIEQIVDAIQRETGEVVQAMEQGTTQVVEGTHLVNNAKQSLGQILQVSHQIDDLMRSVSETSASQVQTSQEITSLIQEVARVADRTSNSSRQVSTSLRQTVKVAKQLRESVETFKVS